MIKHPPWFTELRKIPFNNKPWLIIGKGPSYSNLLKNPEILRNYNTLGLNHVSYNFRTNIALFVDLEVLSQKIQADWILGPQHPHIKFKPISKTIAELTCLPTNFLQYRLSTWKAYNHEAHGNKLYAKQNPIIKVKFFSAEAAFQILGYLGVKEIHTIGIDGGTAYARQFKKLKPLTNGQNTFDKQFSMIESTCKCFNINWKKL